MAKRQRTFWPDTQAARTNRPVDGRTQTIYDPERHPQKALELTSMFGCTNAQLAVLFGTKLYTINEWCMKHPDFSLACRKGRDKWYTQDIERTLARRATGYDYREKTYEFTTDPETGVRTRSLTKLIKKHMPPDPTSIIFYLKCRAPERWAPPALQHKHQVEQLSVTVQTTLADMVSQSGGVGALRGLRDALAALPPLTSNNLTVEDEDQVVEVPQCH